MTRVLGHAARAAAVLCRNEVKIRLYRPRSSTVLQAVLAWLTGTAPEFADPKFPSYAEGRELTRTRSSGLVSIRLSIVTKDMELFGYMDGSQRSNAGIIRHL
jgi:B9 domain-containing protein 1